MRVHIVARVAAHLDRISVQAPDNRCIHRVGRAECAVKKRPAFAIAGSTFAPDRLDTGNIGKHVGIDFARDNPPLNIHRQSPTQRLEAGVHFRSDSARMRARGRLSRPQIGGGKFFGEILQDRQQT